VSWNKAPIWGLEPDIYYWQTVAGLLMWGALTRGWVCRLQLLRALASRVILGSESRGTRNHILLFQIWDFPFCRLHTGQWLEYTKENSFITSGGPNSGHHLKRLSFSRCHGYVFVNIRCSGNALASRCLANGLPLLFVVISAFRRCLLSRYLAIGHNIIIDLYSEGIPPAYFKTETQVIFPQVFNAS
jgi:hypothetical protein